MTSSTQDLVGLEAYSREGEKIGKVKDVVCDPESDGDVCIVIKYGLFRDLVLPADVVEREHYPAEPVGRALPFLRAPWWSTSSTSPMSMMKVSSNPAKRRCSASLACLVSWRNSP